MDLALIWLRQWFAPLPKVSLLIDKLSSNKHDTNIFVTIKWKIQDTYVAHSPAGGLAPYDNHDNWRGLTVTLRIELDANPFKFNFRRISHYFASFHLILSSSASNANKSTMNPDFSPFLTLPIDWLHCSILPAVTKPSYNSLFFVEYTPALRFSLCYTSKSLSRVKSLRSWC